MGSNLDHPKRRKAYAAADEANIELLVSVGGGSTTGLAKAIARMSGLPIIAVPTTYAGSKATNVRGLTEAAHKTTGSDDRVLPVTVIYDSDLTLSLPVDLSVALERTQSMRRSQPRANES